MELQNLTRQELLNLILNAESEKTAQDALKELEQKIKEEKVAPQEALEIYSKIAGMKKESYQFIPENTCIKALELIKDLHGEIKDQIYKELSNIAINTPSEYVGTHSLIILNQLEDKSNVSLIFEAFKRVAIYSPLIKVCIKSLEHLYKLFEKFEETKFFELSMLWEILCRSPKLKVKHLAFLNLTKKGFFQKEEFLDYQYFRSQILYQIELYNKAGDIY